MKVRRFRLTLPDVDPPVVRVLPDDHPTLEWLEGGGGPTERQFEEHFHPVLAKYKGKSLTEAVLAAMVADVRRCFRTWAVWSGRESFGEEFVVDVDASMFARRAR